MTSIDGDADTDRDERSLSGDHPTVDVGSNRDQARAEQAGADELPRGFDEPSDPPPRTGTRPNATVPSAMLQKPAASRRSSVRPSTRKRTLVSTQTKVATTATAVSKASRASWSSYADFSESLTANRAVPDASRQTSRISPRSHDRYVWDRPWSTLHLSARALLPIRGAMTERVLIVDDHPLTRDALSALLAQQGFDVVGEAEDGASRDRAAAELQPDLMLLDLTMPGMDGLTALPQLRERAPDLRDRRAHGVGRGGESPRRDPGRCLGIPAQDRAAGADRRFLHGVARGDAALSGGVARRLLDRVRDGGRLGGVPEEVTRLLSAREVEVLLLLDEHLGTDEIAQRLFISEHTVRSHVKSLLKKLGVSSRREALERLESARAA